VKGVVKPHAEAQHSRHADAIPSQRILHAADNADRLRFQEHRRENLKTDEEVSVPVIRFNGAAM
jgi:hypothetical protein